MEFRNGRHWHAAVVTGAMAVDNVGVQYYPLRATVTRDGIQESQQLRGYPGFIRALGDPPPPTPTAASDSLTPTEPETRRPQ